MSQPAQLTQLSSFSRIFPVLIFNFVIYLNIGYPMAVIPLVVHHDLGFSAILAGLAVSLQYIGTFATRPSAGRRIDSTGPRSSVKYGLLMAAASGILLLIAGYLAAAPWLALAIIALSRLALGWAESWGSTGVIAWNIYRLGPANTAFAISWNGVCSYGGIAIGAALGLVMYQLPGIFGGFTTLAFLSILIPLLCWLLCRRYQPVRPPQRSSNEAAIKFLNVLKLVTPHGTVLVAGSVGFSGVWSFLALAFANNHWDGTPWALLLFGVSFVGVRILFSNQINRRGGLAVTLASLVVEALGTLVIALFYTPGAAILGAALCGAGFSLIFPAMGTLAVERAGPANRASAIGSFSIFQDLGIALSSPLLGYVVDVSSYRAIYIIATVIIVAGAVYSRRLRRLKPIQGNG